MSTDGNDTIPIAIDADLEPILPRYMELQQSELALMEQALADGDAETLRMLGHKLKGSGSSFGFDLLTDMGAAIEQAGMSGDLAEARTQVDRVRHYLEHVQVTFTNGE